MPLRLWWGITFLVSEALVAIFGIYAKFASQRNGRCLKRTLLDPLSWPQRVTKKNSEISDNSKLHFPKKTVLQFLQSNQKVQFLKLNTVGRTATLFSYLGLFVTHEEACGARSQGEVGERRQKASSRLEAPNMEYAATSSQTCLHWCSDKRWLPHHQDSWLTSLRLCFQVLDNVFVFFVVG